MVPAINGTRKLTPKQEAFACAYVETGVGSEAYRRAYNASNMSAGAIRVEACRLLQHPNVALMVQELRNNATDRAALNVAEVLAALIDDHDRAVELGQLSAALRALELLGKHIGMWPKRAQRREIGVAPAL